MKSYTEHHMRGDVRDYMIYCVSDYVSDFVRDFVIDIMLTIT